MSLNQMEEAHKCPVKGCSWSVTITPLHFDLIEYFEVLEEILKEHVFTHPRWQLNRNIRKALK